MVTNTASNNAQTQANTEPVPCLLQINVTRVAQPELAPRWRPLIQHWLHYQYFASSLKTPRLLHLLYRCWQLLLKALQCKLFRSASQGRGQWCNCRFEYGSPCWSRLILGCWRELWEVKNIALITCVLEVGEEQRRGKLPWEWSIPKDRTWVSFFSRVFGEQILNDVQHAKDLEKKKLESHQKVEKLISTQHCSQLLQNWFDLALVSTAVWTHNL